MLPLFRKPDLAAESAKAVKVMSIQTIAYATIVSQVFVFWLSTKGSLFPSADSLSSIISSFSEIIAGLYGITLAGYTFFLSRIDALSASDSTLDYIVDSIKKRFKYLIWFITLNVLVTLFTTLVLMYAPAPDAENIQFFYRLFCNEFVLSVASSILLILYYSILVIDPNSLEKEAAKLKRKLSPGFGPAGDVNAFIAMYDQIEKKCNSLIPAEVLGQIHQNKGSQFSYTIELLRTSHPEMRPLLLDVTRIHRYYECTVNCKKLSVSQDMCLLARKVLIHLGSV